MRAGTDHFKNELGDNHLKEEIQQDKEAEKNIKKVIPDYTKYPREFITYKWYRPLIVAVVFFIFYLLFNVILEIALSVTFREGMADALQAALGGYDTMDVYTAPGALLSLGGVALFIPSLAIANKIAGRRTFKSYESSRGNGWDFGIFFRCLLIGLVVVALPIVIDYFIEGNSDPVNRFTTEGLVCMAILGPMQCIAEEYVFRGFLMQTVGAWFKVPVIAIVLPSLAFAAMHPYNMIGIVEIFISGCFFSIIAWVSHGIEAGSALHICNNISIFVMTGLGYGSISSETDMISLIFSFVIYAVYTLVIIFMRKRGRFSKIKGSDAEKYNKKVQAKLDRKAAKKAAKQA